MQNAFSSEGSEKTVYIVWLHIGATNHKDTTSTAEGHKSVFDGRFLGVTNIYTLFLCSFDSLLFCIMILYLTCYIFKL